MATEKIKGLGFKDPAKKQKVTDAFSSVYEHPKDADGKLLYGDAEGLASAKIKEYIKSVVLQAKRNEAEKAQALITIDEEVFE